MKTSKNDIISQVCKWSVCFLTISLFLFSCYDRQHAQTSIAYEIYDDERAWMDKFFNDLLFVEGAAYTLFGSKPITEIILSHYTEEELAVFLSGLPKEEQENCFLVENYDLPENWEKWERISSRFLIKKYLLFRSHFDEDGKASFVYFVDILKTASVIESNYELFRRTVGFDFHPLEVTLDMPSKDSTFWKNVRASKESALLWGLLFGFGRVNSYAFHWKYFDCPESCKKLIEALPIRFSNPPPRGQVQISLKNLRLPSFASFIDEDKMITRYEGERKKIQKIYQQKDCLDLTLEKLTH